MRCFRPEVTFVVPMVAGSQVDENVPGTKARSESRQPHPPRTCLLRFRAGNNSEAMSMSQVAVDTTVGGKSVLATNGNRRAVFLKAPSTNTATIFLKFDPSATVLTTANGYPLAPGESLVISQANRQGPVGALMGGDGEFWCAILGIVAAGSQTLAVVEL